MSLAPRICRRLPLRSLRPAPPGRGSRLHVGRQRQRRDPRVSWRRDGGLHLRLRRSSGEPPGPAPGPAGSASGHLRRLSAIPPLSLLAAGTFVMACGVSQEIEVPTSSPFASCRIETFGWSRSPGLGQEIWVELVPGVDPSKVVDLSIFSPLAPGMNGDEARSVLGEPAKTEVDRWGETWLVYDRPDATLKLGCSYESSGSTPQGCLWRLFAIVDASREAELFHPELLRFKKIAKDVPEVVEWRTLHVQTSGNREFVSYCFDGQARGQILWHDNEKRAWRAGQPKSRD